ncbi:MAG: hypothetical protein ACYTXC_03240 [Nostoc sp.]
MVGNGITVSINSTGFEVIVTGSAINSAALNANAGAIASKDIISCTSTDNAISIKKTCATTNASTDDGIVASA